MRRFALVLLLLPVLSGCYILTQGYGQLRILLDSRRLDDLLADPTVPDETKLKLMFVREVKSFGEHELGLTRSANYESFYDTKGRPITYIVSACRKDRFQPHTWWFPIVGDVPYKGFFSQADAQAEAEGLEKQGYDVSLGMAAAYSTLGYFPDPVLSTMLEYPEEQLAALILHELTHGTIYLPGGTDFNEGLASFVGWQGALEFARKERGISSYAYDRTVRAFAAEERRDARARDLYQKLDQLYHSTLPREQVLLERDKIAGKKVNNAEILMQRRYGRYDEFRERFERGGGSWRAFFESLVRDKGGQG
ncbi:MAG TPA: aminopeptidase [Planctomycetota bacterium]|nr:aminopeptidase [Planctomycetota bacterium]